MAINERLVHTASATAAAAGTGNQEEGLILHLDANDVDSYDGDGDVWYDITNHEYTPTTDVSEHFNTVTYTGTGATNPITVGFQPDLIWIKNRDQTDSHAIVDSVRGITSPAPYLTSDLNSAEATSTNMPTSVQSDGFTITGSGGRTNTSGEDYVAWCFKAGGAPSGSDKVSIDGTSYSTMSEASLTDGTISIDKLSVNTNLGFSIVSYNGNQVPNATVAHGLGVKPELIIVKNLQAPVSWGVWTTGISDSQVLRLDQTAAATTPATAYFEPQNNTGNVFSLGTNDETNHNDDYIAYCFASKRGVSKVGSYTGTGASGNKVYTGFQPAWLMIKSTGGGSWLIYDNKRDSSNPRRKVLMPHVANTEYADLTDINFEEDGFTIAESGSSNDNTASVKYIYLAFAAGKPDSLIDDTNLEFNLDAGDDTTVSASTWSDSTSNNNDATLSNFSSTLSDFYEKELGNYITFDGSNDYASVPSINFTYQSGFTYELWFRAHSNVQGYICRPSGTGSIPALSWRNYSGWGLTAFHYTGSGGANVNYIDSNLSINKWYHAVYTADSSGGELYIDGELINSNSTSVRDGSASGTFYIGNYNSSAGNNFDGDIGQFRLYEEKLTADQVMQNYRFTKNDYPNGGDGTIYGASFTPAAGSDPDYFSFDGSNDYIELDYIHPTVPKTTANFWIKFADVTPSQNDYFASSTASGGSNANNNFHLGLLTTGRLYAEYGSQWNYLTASASESDLTANTWTMLSFVWSDSSIKYYKNGELKTTTTGFSNIGTTNNNVKLHLGRMGAYNNYYVDMDLGQFKIYDKELTADELVAEFNKHKADYGL